MRPLKAHYPDYLSDPEGLARFRSAVLENSGHDMAAVNHNSLGRLLDTIERLRSECDDARRLAALADQRDERGGELHPALSGAMEMSTDTRGGESALRNRISRALDEPHGLHSERIDAVIAAFASPAAPGGVLPDGWVAVPREATETMVLNALAPGGHRYPMKLTSRDVKACWDAMVVAALLAARPPLSGDRT